MIEPVDKGYYPSVVVNMTIRFDEALQVAESADGIARAIESGEIGLRPEARAAARISGIRVGDITAEHYDQSTGRVVRRTMPNRPGADRAFGPQVRIGDVSSSHYDANGNIVTSSVVTDGSITTGADARRALTPLTFAGDGFTTLMDVVPFKASIDLPHPRQAATFTLNIPYAALPIDPRLVRAWGVEIHLGCVSAEEFGDGQQGRTDANGRSRAILSTRSGLVDPFTGKPAAAESTLLFYGTGDKWRTEHDADNGSWAILTGRSIVGLLLDGKPPVDALKRIDLTRPIHRVIADLIATIPIDQRLALDVYTDASEWPNGKVPSPGSIDGFTNVRLGAADGQPKAGAGGNDRVNYWDLITNLCNLVGGVPHLQGATLWVRPSRSIYEIIDNPGRTPFRADRYGPDGKLAIRRLLIGRNVKRFALERTMGGTPVPVVQTLGFDDRAEGTDRIVTGQWPPADSAAAKAKDESEILRIPIPIRDKERLIQVARDIYEEIGRGEIGGEFETTTLAAVGGDNADPDMLRLRPLEPIEVLVDPTTGPTPIVNELTAQVQMSFQQEVDALRARIGDPDAARAIIAARRGAVVGILDAFRVIRVRYEIAADTGVKVSGEFQNYIVSRHGQTDQIARANNQIERARVENPGQDKRRKIRAEQLRERNEAIDDIIESDWDAFIPRDSAEFKEWAKYREDKRRRRIAERARNARLARGRQQ